MLSAQRCLAKEMRGCSELVRVGPQTTHQDLLEYVSSHMALEMIKVKRRGPEEAQAATNRVLILRRG